LICCCCYVINKEHTMSWNIPCQVT
jgi:hypothetical protein